MSPNPHINGMHFPNFLIDDPVPMSRCERVSGAWRYTRETAAELVSSVGDLLRAIFGTG